MLATVTTSYPCLRRVSATLPVPENRSRALRALLPERVDDGDGCAGVGRDVADCDDDGVVVVDCGRDVEICRDTDEGCVDETPVADDVDCDESTVGRVDEMSVADVDCGESAC